MQGFERFRILLVFRCFEMLSMPRSRSPTSARARADSAASELPTAPARAGDDTAGKHSSTEQPMAYSSILGADSAPEQPSGRDAELLGPSDNSDSGSDTIGTYEAHADSDAVGTGERGSVTPGEGREGGDILPDRVVNADDAGLADPMSRDEAEQALASGEGFPAADPDAREFTDIDAGDADADADDDTA
jgi:hypothetical protein